MKFQIIISVIFLFFSCKNQPDTRVCVQTIIAQDSILGKERNQNCKTISLSETITQYSTGIEKLDYNSCPDSFRIAFMQHSKAWRNLLPITDKYPDLRGEMHDLFRQLQSGADSSVFKLLVDTVWTTWADVERFLK